MLMCYKLNKIVFLERVAFISPELVQILATKVVNKAVIRS